LLSNHLILKNLPHLEVCRHLELSLPLLEVPLVVRPLEVRRHLARSLPLLEVPQVVRHLEVCRPLEVRRPLELSLPLLEVPLVVRHPAESLHPLMLKNHPGANG